MEEFYYQKMDRQKQAVYHGMLQGVRQLADQIQLPRVDGKELYDIFFQMRLDHPEIFWVISFMEILPRLPEPDFRAGISV